MEKIKALLTKVKNGWKGLSKSKKTSIIIIICSLIIAMIIYYFTLGRTEYTPIFTNLDMQDSAQIVETLDERQITEYKIEDGGSTILVPEKEVDKLRLDLAIDGVLPNSGDGFELFDESSYAMTDEDRKILYQRALEGELQRSIQSLATVENARVHLALSEESVFTKEQQPATASIILDLKPSEKPSSEQIKGIISLVSGAVKNLPEENVRVVDSGANLLSSGVLGEEDSFQSSQSTNRRMEFEQEFEDNLENDLIDMLEQTFGMGRVLATVNADLNFDSEESTVISYDPEEVIRSQQVRINQNGNAAGGEGGGPIDSNTNYIDENVEGILEENETSSYESTTNNEMGETTTYTTKAPGEVKRISTSVVYDGTLTPEMQQAMENIIVAATGYDIDRGDMINVEGIPFDTSHQDQLIEDMEQEDALLAQKQQEREELMMYAVIALGVILVLLIVIGLIRYRRKRKQVEDYEDHLVDTHIDEPIPMQEIIQEPIVDIESKSKESTEERSIKEYAQKNPEKMAELIKAWIIEDER